MFRMEYRYAYFLYFPTILKCVGHTLDKANRKVAFVQHKPVQQVLTKIKALSPQDRALLATYLTDEE